VQDGVRYTHTIEPRHGSRTNAIWEGDYAFAVSGLKALHFDLHALSPKLDPPGLPFTASLALIAFLPQWFLALAGGAIALATIRPSPPDTARATDPKRRLSGRGRPAPARGSNPSVLES
jgi:hypothetical protein